MAVVFSQIDSLSQEVYSKNGQQKKLHSVVKNIPFNIRITLEPLAGESKFTFNDVVVEASLYYDSEPTKAVDFIKSNPLEYTTKIAPENPSLAIVETTVKVLSSQHEDSFFVVYFTLRHCQSMEIINIQQHTEPMKVVSKVHQALHPKPKPKKTGGVLITGETPTLLKKRTFTETVVDTISRVEDQQKEQQVLIASLLETTKLLQSSLNILLEKDLNKSIKIEPESENEFDQEPLNGEEGMRHHLNSFLKCYQSLDPESRPEKVRRITESLSEQDSSIAREFIDNFTCTSQKSEPSFTNFCSDLENLGCDIFSSIDLNVS